jgi:hypothetical protein
MNAMFWVLSKGCAYCDWSYISAEANYCVKTERSAGQHRICFKCGVPGHVMLNRVAKRREVPSVSICWQWMRREVPSVLSVEFRATSYQHQSIIFARDWTRALSFSILIHWCCCIQQLSWEDLTSWSMWRTCRITSIATQYLLVVWIQNSREYIWLLCGIRSMCLSMLCLHYDYCCTQQLTWVREAIY